MKTSFAQVFRDIVNDGTPHDRYWPRRKAKFNIVDEKGANLKADQILVINPYVEKYKSEKIATLLVNDKLRQEYETIHNAIETADEALFSQLEKMSGLKDEVREQIAMDFDIDEKEILPLLDKLEQEVKNEVNKDWADIIYRKVFNNNTEDLLESPNFKNIIEEYLIKYNEIIEGSPYFRKNGFGPYNASSISASLKKHLFFTAKHTIKLKDPQNTKPKR